MMKNFSDFIKFVAILWIIKGTNGMRVVSLEVPPRVRRGDKVQLDCLYDLEGNSLYSLKWFFRSTESENEKEEQEFFRFTPRESDKKQYFPLPGLKVDFHNSNDGRLIIDETSDNSTGKYKCEISAEGTFQTISAEKLMIVEGNHSSSSHIKESNVNLILCLIISLLATHLQVKLVFKYNCDSTSSSLNSSSLNSSTSSTKFLQSDLSTKPNFIT